MEYDGVGRVRRIGVPEMDLREPVVVTCPECGKQEAWSLMETGEYGTGYCRTRMVSEANDLYSGDLDMHPEYLKRKPTERPKPTQEQAKPIRRA